MPSKIRRNTHGGPLGGPLQSTILQFAEYLQRAGLSESSIEGYQGPARHFLIWLDAAGTEVGAVDGGVVRQFLNHDCTCLLTHSMGRHTRSLQSGRCVAPIAWFVRFLEESGLIIYHPDTQSFFPSGADMDGIELAALYTLQRKRAIWAVVA